MYSECRYERLLTPKSFKSITERFEVLVHPLPLSPQLKLFGITHPTGELNEQGLPTYRVDINILQTKLQRARTLVHEAVHIYWEEPIKEIFERSSYPDSTSYITAVWQRSHGDHEKRVDKEAKRFHQRHPHFVQEIYNSICLESKHG